MAGDISDYLNTMNKSYGLFSGIAQQQRENRINDLEDQILRQVAERGGDIADIDPSWYQSHEGMEATGRVFQRLSQTNEYQARMMYNAQNVARQKWAMMNQYKADISDAIRKGDVQRTNALLTNVINTAGLRYKASIGADGNLNLGFVSSDGGVKDMGTLSPTEAWRKIQEGLGSEESWIRIAAAAKMATDQENVERFADSRSWLLGTDGNGNAFFAVPQVVERDGMQDYGVYIPQMNRTFTYDELGRMGIRVGPAGAMGGRAVRGMFGLGGVRGGEGTQPLSLPPRVKSNLDVYSTDYVIDELGEQKKIINPYKSEVLTNLAYAGYEPGEIASLWEQNLEAVMQANPQLTRMQASALVRRKMLGGNGADLISRGAEAEFPAPQEGQPQDDPLSRSIRENTGRAASPEEASGSSEYRRPVRINGQWLTGVYDMHGNLLRTEALPKRGRGLGERFSEWKDAVSGKLAETNEEVHRRGMKTGDDYVYGK